MLCPLGLLPELKDKLDKRNCGTKFSGYMQVAVKVRPWGLAGDEISVNAIWKYLWKLNCDSAIIYLGKLCAYLYQKAYMRMSIAILLIKMQTRNNKAIFYSLMDTCIIFMETILHVNEMNDLWVYESLRMSFTNIILSERRQYESIYSKIPY